MEVINQTQKVETNHNISMSYEDIADKLGLTVKEVTDAEASAMRKIRHPKVGKIFKKYLGIGDGLEVNGF
jgi:DNA-directed RNA polymerase sigma subunit (sigma70/sigma32)